MDVDALVIELVKSGRQATDDELSHIVAHVAQAPFASRPIRPPRWLRDALARRGVTMPVQVPAGEAHLLKRIYYDQQWPKGTTIDEFVADLHLAIQHRDVRVWTYEYFGDPCIGLLAPSHIQGTPDDRPLIFVVYNAQYGTLTTGYQASGPETIFNDNHQQLTQHR